MLHIHPFPARMAPEVALAGLKGLPSHYVVLDPMSGSGMVVGTAAKLGLEAIGYDLDPLACMISRVNGTKVEETRVREQCERLVDECRKLDVSSIALPWMDGDEETRRYVEYWFGAKQIEQLRRLSYLLVARPITSNRAILDALRIAVSRLIITKEPKASLARDTAHSRPHRTIMDSEFDILGAVPRSLEHVLSTLAPRTVMRNVSAYRGDARKLGRVRSGSVDCIVTSPPYLNAIDYMRGHRLSLIWFGYSITQLRKIRSRSMGAEISHSGRGIPELQTFFGRLDVEIGDRQRKILQRYYIDLCRVTREAYRVLRGARQATYVIGNSRIKGNEIRNCDLLVYAAERNGFNLASCRTRQIPENKRYMPLLGSQETSLAKRMKTEHIITFVK